MIWIVVVSIGFNIVSFFVNRGSWIRWLNLTVAAIPCIIIAVLEANLISSGCYPWQPNLVEFRPGMTLCPGQSAQFGIQLPEPPK